MKPEPDNRPRILCAMPSSGAARPEAALQSYLLATGGECVIIPAHVCAPSLMCWGFNRALAQALNMRMQGMITHFCLHHDDIEVCTPAWMDVALREMEKVQAAVLSVVVPLKGEGQDTSTALETGDYWNPSRYRLGDCPKETWTEQGLLVNSGLLLVDLRFPQFTDCRPGQASRFFFNISDRIARTAEGEFVAHVASEDWNFSRQCHAAGLPVYATRKIHVIHHGGGQWSNQTEAAS